MTTHTDLSAEEPSERASTGPQFLRANGKITARLLGGIRLDANGKIEVPSSGAIEIALAIFILLLGVALPPTLVAMILATTDVAGWLVGVIGAGLLVVDLAIAAVMITRKGR